MNDERLVAMKPSPVPAAVSSDSVMTGRRQSHFSRRTILLLGVLISVLALLPLSRRRLLSRPGPPPPASAGIRAAMRYYAARIAADPSDVKAYVELGKLDEASGYYTDALKHLYAARALGAKDQQIVAPLGQSLTFLAHYQEARVELQKALRLMPDRLDIAVKMAQLCEADGKPQEAAQVLRDFVARHPALETGTAPNVGRDLEELMYGFLKAGDEESAYKMADDLIRLSPSSPIAYSIAGKILLARNEPKSALQYMEKASQLAPKEAILCYAYGMALARNGREEDALKQWQKTVTLNPAAINAYYRLAETYSKRKDYAHMAAALNHIALQENTKVDIVQAAAEASAKAGQKTPAAYWRFREAYLRKNYPTALANARLVATDPKWRVRGLTALAECYQGMNQFEAYLDVERQLTAGHTAEDDVAMAQAYGTADRLTEQGELLQSALAKNPRDPAHVYLLLSQLAERKGRRDEAEAALEKAVALEPQNPLYHQSLGNLYYERRNSGDRLQRAIREFEQFTHLDMYEVEGYKKLGLAYSAANDLPRAARNLEHALDLLPGDGATYQELGRVYARTGDRAGSERMLQLYRLYVAYDLQKQGLLTKSKAARKDPAAQIAVAEFLERSGDYAMAAQYYRLAVSLRPADAVLRAKVRQIDTMSGQGDN